MLKVSIGAALLLFTSGVVGLGGSSGATIASDSRAVERERGLFSWEKEHLTDVAVADLAKFPRANSKSSRGGKCKAFPGEESWPAPHVWEELNAASGGNLKATVPLAAVCYQEWPEHYSPEKCAEVTRDWNSPHLHVNDPTSTHWPIFQGLTCVPPSLRGGGNCTLGGYASYSLTVDSVADIQLAIGFARKTGVRLVVKNTGHDFADKSIGAGALSIWTRRLNDIRFIKNHSHRGPAFKLGAGVLIEDAYKKAEEEGVTVVGGVCRTVGIAGGYFAGGGHSPVMGLWGMAADQVLSLEIVLPAGRFVTASAAENPDLFWAVRGGGGSTFGVVTSIIIKAHPQIPVSSMTLNFSVGGNITSEIFWAAFKAYCSHYIPWVDAGTYGYFFVIPTGPNSFVFDLTPFFAPNKTVSQLKEIVSPWLNELKTLGIDVDPVFNESSSFMPGWEARWAPEMVGSWTQRAASRLFPRSNFDTPTAVDRTVAAARYAAEQGAVLIGYHMRVAANAGQDNAVNPAWRATASHWMLGNSWAANASWAEMEESSRKMTVDLMKVWREASPGAGAYMSESDINEPDWQQSFFGSNYKRLYELKQKIDPTGVFYAPQAVGSEDWEVVGQRKWLPGQDGKLCRKQ